MSGHSSQVLNEPFGTREVVKQTREREFHKSRRQLEIFFVSSVLLYAWRHVMQLANARLPIQQLRSRDYCDIIALR